MHQRDFVCLHDLAQADRQTQYSQMSAPQHIGEPISAVIEGGMSNIHWWIVGLIVVIVAVLVPTLVVPIVQHSQIRDDLKRVNDECKNDECPCVNELNELMAESQRRPCDPAGVPDGKGCYYSSTAYLNAVEAHRFYLLRYVSPAYLLFRSGFQWEYFVSGVQEWDYAVTPAEKAAYTALKVGRQTLQQMDTAAALPTTTDMERLLLKLKRHEMALSVDLMDLNFQHTQSNNHWNLHWAFDDLLLASWLPAFSAEPDYDDKALLYMQNLAVQKIKLIEFYTRAWTYHSPPQVESEFTCTDLGPFVTSAATTDLHDPICDAMTDAAKQADCYVLSAQIDSDATTLDTLFNGNYCAAAATYRSSAKPGLGHVHNGNETFEVWTRYMTNLNMTMDERLAMGNQLAQEGRDEMELILQAEFGETFNDWVSQASDFDDPRYNICFDTIDEVKDYLSLSLRNVTDAYSVEFVHHPRCTMKLSYGGLCCAVTFGDYNPYTNTWDEQILYLWGEKGMNSLDQFCVDRFQHSIAMHEGYAGHFPQNGFHQQVKCNEFPLIWSFNPGYVEGYASYSELQCNKTTLCDNPMERLYNIWWSTQIIAIDTVADILINYLGGSYQDCIDLYVDNGLTSVPPQSVCDRTLKYPGQLQTYIQGSRFIASLRTYAELTLGGDFKPTIFNMLLTKWGFLTFDELYDIVHTWVVWTQDRDAGLLLPWGRTIDKELFKSADPVAALAFVIPNTGAVLTSSVQTTAAAQQISALRDTDSALDTLMQKLDQISRNRGAL